MGRKHGQETPIDASAECARLHTDRRTGDFMTIDRDSFLKKYNILECAFYPSQVNYVRS